MMMIPTDDLFQRGTYSWLCKGMVEAVGCPPKCAVAIHQSLSCSSTAPPSFSSTNQSCMPWPAVSKPNQTHEKVPSTDSGGIGFLICVRCSVHSRRSTRRVPLQLGGFTFFQRLGYSLYVLESLRDNF